MKKNLLLYGLVIAIIFSNCTIQPISNNNNIVGSENTQTNFQKPLIETGIWEEQFFSQDLVRKTDGFKSSEIVAFYDNSLWIRNDGVVYKYQTQTEEITSYKILYDGQEASPGGLFYVSKNNILWAVGLSFDRFSQSSSDLQNKPYWILRYFDKSSNSFVEVKDVSQNLYTWMVTPKKIVEDKKGNLWILLIGGEQSKPRLIYYSLKDNEAISVDITKYLLDFPFLGIRDIAMDNQGMLWLSIQAQYLPNHPNPQFHQTYYWEIYRFNPETKELSSFDKPNGDSAYSSIVPSLLYIDKQNRLWINSISYLDLINEQPAWSPSLQPVQLFTKTTGWNPPTTIYETSDGSFWLGGAFGLKVYYPPTNQWYGIDFVTGEEFSGINVIEDDNNQVWLFADGRIYKLTQK